ncbi:MAG: N-acetylglucosamine-6-phosphate deacetylase [Albidovulum sp.]
MNRKAYLGAAIHDGVTLHHGGALLCQDGVACEIVGADNIPDGCELHRLKAGYITPAFVDLQVNGGGGVMFNDDQSAGALEIISGAHAKTGTRALLPTLITDTAARSRLAIAAVEDAIEQGVPGIVGIHLEGPHLSIGRKGAHEPALIRPMTDHDVEMIIGAARRLPNVMITAAPENMTTDQVARLTDAGVIVSLGHTDADYDTAMAYMRAGASCSTHLFNAMSQLGNREPGLVGATLDNPSCAAGLIADGVHVHPATIRAALRAKTGPSKIFLVTDAMSSVGSDLHEFELNGRTVFRSEGTLRLADGTLAGADIDMPRSIGVLINQVGIDPERAIAMATAIPAGILKSPGANGRLLGATLENVVYLNDALKVGSLT